MGQVQNLEVPKKPDSLAGDLIQPRVVQSNSVPIFQTADGLLDFAIYITDLVVTVKSHCLKKIQFVRISKIQ